MAKLRFVILQVILGAGLVAAWLTNSLDPLLSGPHKWPVAGILAVGGIGLALAAFGRSGASARIRDYFPMFAVIGMQFSLLPALAHLAGAMSAGDPTKAAAVFIAAVGTALYVSVSALCSYVWISLTLWWAYGE